MTASFMVVEVIGGFLSGSLALLADAGHMLTDSASIGLALFAIWLAKRPASAERTYGYNRAEILAAAANALSLWLIAAWIIWEAIHRFINPADIEGGTVLIVGAIGHDPAGDLSEGVRRRGPPCGPPAGAPDGPQEAQVRLRPPPLRLARPNRGIAAPTPLKPGPRRRCQASKGPRPSWSRTVTTGGLVIERRNQLAPSTTNVCPEMNRP